MSIIDNRITMLQVVTECMALLLDKPEPGLTTWMVAVAKCRDEINAIMDGKRDDASPPTNAAPEAKTTKEGNE